jgi:hypothetical protein
MAKEKKSSKQRQPEAIWHLIFKSTQKQNHTQDMNNIKTAHRKKRISPPYIKKELP